MPSLKWSIIKAIPAYSKISKKCQLCLQEKFEILNYPNPNELLNKRSELIYCFYCVTINLMTRPNGKCPIR